MATPGVSDSAKGPSLGPPSDNDQKPQAIRVDIASSYVNDFGSIQEEHSQVVGTEEPSTGPYFIETDPPTQEQIPPSSRQPMKESSSSFPGNKTAGAGFALFLGGAAAVTYLGVSSGLSLAFIAGGASFGGVAIFLLIAIAAAHLSYQRAQNTNTVASKALLTVGTFGVGFYAIPIIIMLKFGILEIEQKSRSEVDAGVEASPIERRRSNSGIPAQGSKKPKDNGRSGSASEPDILKSTDRLQQGKKNLLMCWVRMFS